MPVAKHFSPGFWGFFTGFLGVSGAFFTGFLEVISGSGDLTVVSLLSLPGALAPMRHSRTAGLRGGGRPSKGNPSCLIHDPGKHDWVPLALKGL